MFLKKKKIRYEDLLNNSSTQAMQKYKPNEKIKKIIEEVKPKIIEELKPKFIKPKTDEEWKAFHKMNEEGMKKAYKSKEGYYKDNNKLYIAGTKDMGDVMDWAKIPLGTFKDSKIYKKY